MSSTNSPSDMDRFKGILENITKHPKSITSSACKFVYKQLVAKNKIGIALDPIDIIDEQNLWLVDEWAHVGFCVLALLDNKKLVSSYKAEVLLSNGKIKSLDALLGATIKLANMTVDAGLIRELLPLIIQRHF